MRNSVQLRCAQLERSVRALHDECDRLTRENELLRQRMHGSDDRIRSIQQVDAELAWISRDVDDDACADNAYARAPVGVSLIY